MRFINAARAENQQIQEADLGKGACHTCCHVYSGNAEVIATAPLLSLSLLPLRLELPLMDVSLFLQL